MARAYTVVDKLMALSIFACLGACAGISSLFQGLNIWTSQSPSRGNQLWGRGAGFFETCGKVCVERGDAYLTPRGKFKEV